MPAAGYGYLWPLVTFESDGQEIDATCHASNPLSHEPVRYLVSFREAISALTFEQTLDGFVNLVLARLDALGIVGTHLHDLWGEVREERADPELARNRKIEVRLGFDPGEAPVSLMRRLDALGQSAGEGAVDEIAPVCAGPQHAEILDRIEQFSALPGLTAHVSMPELFRPPEGTAVTPWEEGRNVARMARRQLGLEHQPISNKQLADVLGVSDLPQPGALTERPIVGLAIRSSEAGRMKLLFRRRNMPGLRFEAARFLSEQILAPRTESWLPATDTGTARQKVQRSFAAEFLCPIGALRPFLNGDFSPEAIEEAGEHFGVSDVAVKSVLANHREVPFDWVST